METWEPRNFWSTANPDAGRRFPDGSIFGLRHWSLALIGIDQCLKPATGQNFPMFFWHRNQQFFLCCVLILYMDPSVLAMVHFSRTLGEEYHGVGRVYHHPSVPVAVLISRLLLLFCSTDHNRLMYGQVC